jgi:pimeloyl-ACP methyl ester carboxylesterase
MVEAEEVHSLATVSQLRDPGLGVAIADGVMGGMSRLGYEKFVISAGDVGCDVAEAIAGRYPDAVLSLHLTDVSQYHFLVDLPAVLSPVEEAYVRHGRDWQARGRLHARAVHQAAHPCGRLG